MPQKTKNVNVPVKDIYTFTADEINLITGCLKFAVVRSTSFNEVKEIRALISNLDEQITKLKK